MTKTKKIVSLVLAVVILMSTLVVTSLMTASAADETEKLVDIGKVINAQGISSSGEVTKMSSSPFGSYPGYSWIDDTQSKSHEMVITGAKEVTDMTGKAGLEFMFFVNKIVANKLEVSIVAGGETYTQSLAIRVSMRRDVLRVPMPFDMFTNEDGDRLMDPSKIDMKNGSPITVTVSGSSDIEANFQFSDIYVYTGDYPSMVLPDGAMDLDTPYIPITTQPQTGDGSKVVMSFNPKEYDSVNGKWTATDLALPHQVKGVFHSAPFDFTDDEGFSFPSYLNVYEITTMRPYMQHQLILRDLDGSCLEGSLGLEVFVYLASNSSTTSVIPKLETVAYDENGEPVLDANGQPKLVYYQPDPSAENEEWGRMATQANKGVITRLQIPWYTFQLQNASTNEGVVRTMEGDVLEKQLASANRIILSFGYQWVNDQVDGFDPETDYPSGPVGYIGDIRTYTVKEQMFKQVETATAVETTTEYEADDGGIKDPLAGLDPELLSGAMREIYDLMTYLPVDPSQVTVDDYYTILSILDLYNNGLSEMDLMMFPEDMYNYLVALEMAINSMDTSGRPITTNPQSGDALPYVGITVFAVGAAGVAVGVRKRRKKA